MAGPVACGGYTGRLTEDAGGHDPRELQEGSARSRGDRDKRAGECAERSVADRGEGRATSDRESDGHGVHLIQTRPQRPAN